MDSLAQLRSIIELEIVRLRQVIPSNRRNAVLAILCGNDRYVDEPSGAETDVVFGRPLHHPGVNKAIALVLESGSDGEPVVHTTDDWAMAFLKSCQHLIEAEEIVKHIESGFMRCDATADAVQVWIASKQIPPSWRERDDIAWWSQQSTSETWQFGYPADAVLYGLHAAQWLNVLTTLRRYIDGPDEAFVVAPWIDLIEAVANDLVVGHDAADHAVRGFLVDQANAEHHGTVPGIALAPLIDIGDGNVVLSRAGLTSQPLLFLTREIRRRSGQDYHNSSTYRETLFRKEVYDLFADKRFVTSMNRIELRSQQGNLRTDVDAAVFDRKTGSLATFELKSQDPFARSEAELTRQRDNFLYANRQVSGMLDWLNRNSANELLNRVDSRTAKHFRVQNVYPFVVGRYLAHFAGGAQQDRRAGWCTWPQLLRELERQPLVASGTNPLASLFTRIKKGPVTMLDLDRLEARTIVIGGTQVRVYPTYRHFQAASRDGPPS
ncbi:MAG: hypothetical protein WKF81_09470 [Thermomicrobiales bacterium]